MISPAQIHPPRPVIGWLSARGFARARRHEGFSLWADWREFRDERDALFFGLGCAGVTAQRQLVPYDAFERWSRLTGAAMDVDGLDEFASLWLWRASDPQAPVVGVYRDGAATQGVPVRADLFLCWRDEIARLGLFPAPTLDDYATQAIACCIPVSSS